MTTFDISNLILRSTKNDISYVDYNRPELPYMLNATYIYHDNTNYNNGSYSQQLGTMRNNLIIESADRNIILSTQQDKNVIVQNNMIINNKLDVSNTITTNNVNTNDISLINILYLNSSLGLESNIIGDLKIQGSITQVSGINQQVARLDSANSRITKSVFIGGNISGSNIYLSTVSDVSINNSYIYNTSIGYNNNILDPSKAVFTDVSLNSLTIDRSLNSGSLGYIKLNNLNDNNNSIIIRSSNDSKLEITRPLIIGQSITNISNISIFNGDISCNTLYYKQLNPDIKLNTYFDVSIGNISLSGDIIPVTSNSFTIGSPDYRFNNIYSTTFNGYLDGSANFAYDLKRNLDMSFNNLDISGSIRFNGIDLTQTLTGSYITISGADISFANITQKITDVSVNSASKLVSLQNYFDSCFNNPIYQSIRDISSRTFDVSSNVASLRSYIDICFNNPIYLSIRDISSRTFDVSSNVASLRSYIDSCFNNPVYISIRDISSRTLDVSLSVVSLRSYIDSCFNNPLYRRITDVSSSLNTLNSSTQTSFNNVYTKTATHIYASSTFVLKTSDVNNYYTRAQADSTFFTFYNLSYNSTANTITIMDKFKFYNTGYYEQTVDSNYSSDIICEWRTNVPSTNSAVIRFYSNGDMMTNTGVFQGSSDIRLKENIVDTSPKLLDLLKVRIVDFKFKGADTRKHIGVIAQELETIFPNLVSENESSQQDISAGKAEKYKCVKYSCFSVILIKALQEEQEIINKLDSRITALNQEYNIYKDLQEHTKVLRDNINTLKQENMSFKSKLNEILSELGKNKK
jgi:hypothetical protein